MEIATFHYGPAERKRSFEAEVPTPPPHSFVKRCPDGLVRRFQLAAAIHVRGGGQYTRIDYEMAPEVRAYEPQMSKPP
jgi:hypothetical protein